MTILELTDADDDQQVFINFDHVLGFNVVEGGLTEVNMINDTFWTVKQTPAQIVEAMK